MINGNSPEEIENLLLEWKKFNDTIGNCSALPDFERVTKSKFRQEQADTCYSSYVSSGDHHYLVGRLLFLLNIFGYAQFCCQQAVENYLKAYIKLQNIEPPLTHSLKDLLEECRKVSNSPPFIHSIYIELIVQKFDPFNELARYPVQKTRPASRAQWYDPENDTYTMDYFVYKMREIIKLPNNQSDVFNGGHNFHLGFFQHAFPDIFMKLKENNINFS